MINGLFLVRVKDASKGAFVLSMVVQRQPIHHLLEMTEEGIYLVNGKTFGNFALLPDLIKAMRIPSFVGNRTMNATYYYHSDAQHPFRSSGYRGCSP